MPEPEKKPMNKSFLVKILLCAAAGILLIVVGNAVLARKETTENTDPSTAGAVTELDAYREKLQNEIATLCASVSGAGKATVAVTLSGGFTYKYATDYKTGTGGGSTESYVTTGSGASESPIYLSVKPPGIAGIGVVCEGGGDAAVRRELIALLSAAYGIGTNKIYVTASG